MAGVLDDMHLDWSDPEHVTLSNGCYPWRTRLIHDGPEAVVIKVPGHSFFGGIGIRSYAPAQFEVWLKPADLPRGATSGKLHRVAEWLVRPLKAGGTYDL